MLPFMGTVTSFETTELNWLLLSILPGQGRALFLHFRHCHRMSPFQRPSGYRKEDYVCPTVSRPFPSLAVGMCQRWSWGGGGHHGNIEYSVPLPIAQYGTNIISLFIQLAWPSKCVNFNVGYLYQYMMTKKTLKKINALNDWQRMAHNCSVLKIA